MHAVRMRAHTRFYGRGPVAKVTARLTTLYLTSRDTSSVTERDRFILYDLTKISREKVTINCQSNY